MAVAYSQNGVVIKSGGKTGIIFEADFKNYAGGTLTPPYIVPNIGATLWFRKSFSYMSLTSNGLEITDRISSNSQRIPLYGYGGRKLKFRQITKGIYGAGNSNWCSIGLHRIGGYINDYTSSRGMGMLISYNALALGTLKNGFTANWGYTEDTEPSSSTFVVPPTRLYPIDNAIIDAEAIFDMEEKSITYYINGVEAFSGVMSDEIFYQELQVANTFGFNGDGVKAAVEKITISCE